MKLETKETQAFDESEPTTTTTTSVGRPEINKITQPKQKCSLVMKLK